ncbi:exfoliative toxin [Streptococcus pyogenes]|nr:exfoliative toxin [Streptococcus pyogenes]
MIDLKRNLFKIDVRAQKDEEKVFMRTACIFLGYVSIQA